MMPTTSSLRSGESFSHQEIDGRGDGGVLCDLLFEAEPLRGAPPFLEGRTLPAGFVFFLGEVVGFKRGMNSKELKYEL